MLVNTVVRRRELMDVIRWPGKCHLCFVAIGGETSSMLLIYGREIGELIAYILEKWKLGTDVPEF